MQIRAVCSIQTALFAAHGTVRQYHKAPRQRDRSLRKKPLL